MTTQLDLFDLLTEPPPETVVVDWLSPAGEIHRVWTTPERAAAMATERTERERQFAALEASSENPDLFAKEVVPHGETA